METPSHEAPPRAAPAPTLRLGDWMRQALELRLARGWLAGGAVLLFVLLVVALD